MGEGEFIYDSFILHLILRGFISVPTNLCVPDSENIICYPCVPINTAKSNPSTESQITSWLMQVGIQNKDLLKFKPTERIYIYIFFLFENISKILFLDVELDFVLLFSSLRKNSRSLRKPRG